MGCQEYRSYKRTYPYWKNKVNIILYLELDGNTLRKVMRLSKTSHNIVDMSSKEKLNGN